MRHHPPHLTTARVVAPLLLSLALLALFAQGCSRQTTSDPGTLEPGSGAGSLLGADPSPGQRLDGSRIGSVSHMPLAVGNTWDYTVHTRTQLITDGVPGEITLTESPWRSQITEERTIEGTDYFMQAEYDPNSLANWVSRYALREDRSGLYNKDLITLPTPARVVSEAEDAFVKDVQSAVARAAATSPHRAAFEAAAVRLGARVAAMRQPGGMIGRFPRRPGPGAPRGFNGGGPRPDEITMLSYPLHMGSSWIVRDDPRFERLVIAREHTTVPAGQFIAWVLRASSELYGPNDRVHLWYARQGLIKLTIHADVNVVDDTGNIIGRAIVDVTQDLSGLTLETP